LVIAEPPAATSAGYTLPDILGPTAMTEGDAHRRRVSVITVFNLLYLRADWWARRVVKTLIGIDYEVSVIARGRC